MKESGKKEERIKGRKKECWEEVRKIRKVLKRREIKISQMWKTNFKTGDF